jgi:hypothetical protein
LFLLVLGLLTLLFLLGDPGDPQLLSLIRLFLLVLEILTLLFLLGDPGDPQLLSLIRLFLLVLELLFLLYPLYPLLKLLLHLHPEDLCPQCPL